MQNVPHKDPAGNTYVNVHTTQNPAGEIRGQIKVTQVPLPPLFNVSGFKINNATGSGIPGWNITLMNSTMQTSMSTGADGSYKFMNLVNGTYNVTEETKSGFMNAGPTTVHVTVNGSDVMNINFTNAPIVPTPKTFNISGFKIRSDTGAGVQGWNITLTNSTMTANATTDANGMYIFTGLSNGSYNVTEQMMTNWTPASATTLPVVVNGSDVMNQNFTNAPPSSGNGTIAGTVTNASSGMAISGATVTADGMTATTDASGSYNISIAAGTYDVAASAPGYEPDMKLSVLVTQGNVTSLNFALTPLPPTISGTVTDASSGLPIHGATVTADGMASPPLISPAATA